MHTGCNAPKKRKKKKKPRGILFRRFKRSLCINYVYFSVKMSSQTGNVSRSRGQKHQNVTAFKNDKYGASAQVKKAKSKVHDGLCQHCKDVLEWKVKYNKFKPLTQPRKCVKCLQKTVKDAYHIICKPCALKLELCAKCGKKEEIVIPLDKKEEEEVEDTSQRNKGKRQKKRDEEEDEDEDFDDLGFSNDDCDSDSEAEGN